MDCKIKTCCNYFANIPNPIFMSDWCSKSWCKHGEFVLKQYLKLQRPRNRWWRLLWLWLLSWKKCSCHGGFSVNNRPVSRLPDECRISIWMQESLDFSSFTEKAWIERNLLVFSSRRLTTLFLLLLVLLFAIGFWSDNAEVNLKQRVLAQWP